MTTPIWQAASRREDRDDRLLRGGLAAERVGPRVRCQLADEAVRVRGDAEEDVLQVLKGRDVDQLAALDERIEERGATGALEAARKEPVLATDGDDAELVLGARMPPARLCRAMRMSSWIDPISPPTIVADAA